MPKIMEYGIICFFANNENVSRVRYKYYHRFPGQQLPPRNAIKNIVGGFIEIKNNTRILIRNQQQDLDMFALCYRYLNYIL